MPSDLPWVLGVIWILIAAILRRHWNHKLTAEGRTDCAASHLPGMVAGVSGDGMETAGISTCRRALRATKK